ncbi:MAG: hypothetical protein R6V03_00920, partial [Kiritimatiellia bacterium]
RFKREFITRRRSMKRISAILLIWAFLLCMAAPAATNEVTSVNIVGYTRLNLGPSNSLLLVGFNFEDVATAGPVMLKDLLGTNQLRQATLPTLADVVHYWDAEAVEYVTVYQKSDGNFYLTDDMTTVTNFPIETGDAFWLQSPSGASDTNQIVISGAVDCGASSLRDIPTGLSQFTHPYATPLDINSTNVDWIAEGATAGNLPTLADVIHIWDGTQYDTYFLKSDDKWYDSSTFNLASNAIIGVGCGAWYEAKSLYTNEFVRPFSID